MKAGLYCKALDKDNSGLKCGHPLPCPYHTAIIDVSQEPAEVRIPITAKAVLKNKHHLENIAGVLLID
jgi:hypothetical protein